MVLHDGNGRMSRLLTLLLFCQNGYEVGKYISVEKKIKETRDAYYGILERVDAGWHEEQNDPTSFIKYMLQVVLACHTEFEAFMCGRTLWNHSVSSNYGVFVQMEQ